MPPRWWSIATDSLTRLAAKTRTPGGLTRSRSSNPTSPGRPIPPKPHEYTLTRTSGEALILDDGVKSITAAADQIKAAVFARLAPTLIQRYQAGEALTFGPVTVQQQTGLRRGNQHHAWQDIQNIQVQNGRFQLSLRNGQHAESRASTIPNIELLGQLIGVNPIQMQLVYI
jgi:hypothetical protein